MTKHDTWVKLKPGSPYDPILDLFPDGVPMRDPFPLERVTVNGEQVALWVVDFERLDPAQANALAELIASHRGAEAVEVIQEAFLRGGFAMPSGWVESMECDAEGFQRTKEIADFFETAPQPPSKAAWQEFYNSQHERWIDGDEQPPPINSIDDIDPRLRTPELELRWKMRQIEQVIACGGYSVFDVLSGTATADVLNKIDPNNEWSLVRDDDFEDDDIYE